MRNDEKVLKDPVYGYISIPRDLMKGIVDTPEFQRLRDVVQTSYTPLFSSAVHNRFSHSIGVYFLGKTVAQTIQESLSEEEKSELKSGRVFEVFLLACMLHDVGHSPFSHTGEEYFEIAAGTKKDLYKALDDLLEDKNFLEDVYSKANWAAAHEIMSAIVALNRFGSFLINSEEKSFFARCILGHQYIHAVDKKHSFLNCVISLLNSACIDVDKLDYLIRDSYFTGFNTVNIDYVRLLNHMAVKVDGNVYKLVYKKGAISILENVVIARDAERKWIQNHPVVLYENYLLQTIMREIVDDSDGMKVFSYDALTEKGIEYKNGFRIRLLSDSDIIFLMKNSKKKEAEEFFNRGKRRHPLWKAEAEYNAILQQGYSKDDFDRAAELWGKYHDFVIDEKALRECQEDIDRLEELIKKESDSCKKKHLEAMRNSKEKKLTFIRLFKDFAKKENIDFDFLILQAKVFSSGFSTEDFANLDIWFESTEKLVKFRSVTQVLKVDIDERSENAAEKKKLYSYLFCPRSNRGQKTDLNSLAAKIGRFIRDNSADEMEASFMGNKL